MAEGAELGVEPTPGSDAVSFEKGEKGEKGETGETGATGATGEARRSALIRAHRRRMFRLGAALGLAAGPAAAFGQGWAGTGDARAHVWLIACAVAALLGAVTLGVFYPHPGETGDGEGEPLVEPGPGPGFGALFGLTVGLVAGAFAAFPMGSVMGGVGGAVGAALGGLVWRRLGLVAAALAGPALGLFSVWLWVL